MRYNRFYSIHIVFLIITNTKRQRRGAAFINSVRIIFLPEILS